MCLQNDSGSTHRDISTVLKQLPKILQIILATEGTVTEILSKWIGDDVRVEKISERSEITYDRTARNEHKFDTGTLLDERTVLVRSGRDNRPLVMAVSAVYLEYLPDYLKHKLHDSDTGIGKLLRAEKIPTHREIEDLEFLPVPAVARFHAHFPDEKSGIIHRSYDIYTGMQLTRKILRINEYWPASIKL